MTELIDRLEKAASGGRDLDALIEIEHRRFEAYAVGLNDEQRAHWRPVGTKGEVEEGGTRYHPPLYSFSIDAALRLAPERSLWSVCDMEDGPYAQIIRPMPNGGFVGGLTTARGKTAALAMCAAALKAKASTFLE
jgi:hypothetical protein